MERTEYDVSLILVNYNTRDLTLQALDSVRDCLSQQRDVEIIVVDNGSSDGSVEAIASRFPGVRTIEVGRNIGFGPANNVGAANARGRYLFFLNTDTILESDPLPVLISTLEAGETRAVVGASLRNADGTYQESILLFPTLWRIFCVFSMLDRIPHRFFSGVSDIGADPNRRQRIEVAHGAAMMCRADAFRNVGGFDDGFFMYFEECDLCRRLADAGWETWYDPEAVVVHLIGGSSRAKRPWFYHVLRESRRIYAKKHFSLPARIAVAVIVHLGYGARIVGMGIAGIWNRRLREQSRNMLKSYLPWSSERVIERG